MSHTSDRSVRTPLENIKLDVPTMNPSNIKDLITKRSSIKGRITKYSNFLTKFIDSYDKYDKTSLLMLTQRFERFKDLMSIFDDCQSQIEFVNSNSLESELDTREEIETDFSTLIAKTQVILEKNQIVDDYKSIHSGSGSDCNKSCGHNKSFHFKLPTLKIGSFDGTYFKWIEFRDTYTSLIHNNDNIDPIHKFHYLNSYLEGEASRVISNLEVSAVNYKEAWHLLCERYNNEKQLIHNHLNSLCNIRPITRDSAKGIRFLIDHVSKNLRALNKLGEPTQSWDTLVIHLVSAKLDGSTSIKWEEHKNSFEKSPSLNDFFCFLKRRADVLESFNHIKPDRVDQVKVDHNSSFNQNRRSHSKSFVVSAKTQASASSPSCVFCRGSHRLYDCASFLSKPVEDRISEASRLKVCLNCLRKGHSSHQCRLSRCSICERRHNTLLHRESSQPVNSSQVHAVTSNTETALSAAGHNSESSICGFTNHFCSNNALLSTALIEIQNPTTNKSITVRALLDSGSQSSLITKRMTNLLQLTSLPVRVDILGVGNLFSSNALERCVVNVKSKYKNFKIQLSCLVLPQITSNIPNKTFDISQLHLPSNIQFADPNFNRSAPIDMLLGTDIFWDLIESQQIKLGPNKPIIRKSKLGWILAGPMYTRNTNSVFCNLAIEHKDISNDRLNETVKMFWELEQIPTVNNKRTEEEILCEQHFCKNTYRNKDGRFCVKLPLITAPDCLGDSFRSAKRQFLALEKRFVKNPILKQSYSEFIKEYADLGHLTESPVFIPNQSFFIPHHAVFKPSSESTKLRVVFNGSAKTTSGYSINDIQMTGPYIQDSLFNILIRFRQYTYVLFRTVIEIYK
ncbi:uncharacterized protein LOC131846562 [Achroia grisella]|uniref:uncharacterized protein LOC131846562 n=1 Tax=Achroia grisella TaxID=688607 RepID=UPI0027D242A4|nr:uncharacterized protein LOC131846562 [Achroia grisella]